jgi:hypothetical protein
MPDDGTRVVYRTVISTYPGTMLDPIVLGMLKQYWVVILWDYRASLHLPPPDHSHSTDVRFQG